MNKNTCNDGCECGHHQLVPFLLIILGLLFLVANLGWVEPYLISIVWPILIIVIGLVKLGDSKCSCC